MKKERINLSYKELTKNAGQIAWLPSNPRTWTADDVRRTEASIQEDPDFLEDRPLLVVVDVPGNYVVFAGNLRCEAVARLKMRAVPCVLYTPEGPEDELAIVRRAMKDNGSFGSWDYDAIANEWGDLPLQEWGVPVWTNDTTKKETAEKPTKTAATTGDADPLLIFSVGLTPQEFAFVKGAISEAGADDREGLLALLGYNPDEEAVEE